MSPIAVQGRALEERAGGDKEGDRKYLRTLLQALQAARAGDFSARLPTDQVGLAGKIADAFNDVVSANERMAQQLEQVGQIVGREGRTRKRLRLGVSAGAWGEMESSVNALIDDLLWPTAAERRVEARTAELAAANAELEERVEARTREREAALAQVAEMQKLESLGQLTGGVAHDFNNLLMVVMSNLDMARSRVADDARLTRWLGRAMEAATRGAALTKHMLAFARRQDLKPESIALSAVVKGMVEMMSHSLDPNVRIAIDLPSDLPRVRIDRNQLELALLNLGLNARDAMPNGGELLVKARVADHAPLPDKLAPGSYVHLSVIDSGLGMDAETLARASEPFFSTKPAGSGLGLSMVHGLTLQSGGAMHIASRPNEGTSVSLWLPVAQGPVSTEQALDAPDEFISSRRRVLLVDDDPLVLAATADMVRELGHETIETTSAKKALEILRTGERPDLAILDYAMPEMSGLVLADLIRKIHPALPLLLATGYSEQEKAAGNLPRLDKPYTSAELARQIDLLAAGAQ